MRRLRRSALAWPALLALLLPPAAGTAALLAGATPDCGSLPPEPYPLQQRLRHLARLGVDRWHAAGFGGRGHEALARTLGPGKVAGDVLCFASAGNTAQRHWAGPFHAGREGFHEWRPGQTDNRLTPWGDERVSVELCWPCGPAYQLFVFDALTGEEVGRSSGQCGAERCSAVVQFHPKAERAYDVRVRLVRGRPGSFHVVA